MRATTPEVKKVLASVPFAIWTLYPPDEKNDFSSERGLQKNGEGRTELGIGGALVQENNEPKKQRGRRVF